jgi:hypothetical protein
MKYTFLIAATIVSSAFAVSPASSRTMLCSGEHLSKMMTTISEMPDGPHKWEMYKHLQMVNTAMAKDGVRGCDMMMTKMMRGSKMKMMKSAM